MTLRFNLGRGENYMKWKITTKIPKEKIYLDPNEVTLELVNCKLHNNKNQSNKIFEGGHKRVCAWIECDDILVSNNADKERSNLRIHYNPRELPYWTDPNGHDLDGWKFDKLVTKGNKVYAAKRARMFRED